MEDARQQGHPRIRELNSGVLQVEMIPVMCCLFVINFNLRKIITLTSKTRLYIKIELLFDTAPFLMLFCLIVQVQTIEV